MREIIATGKTVEEATENACTQLGLSREDVSVEILEMPAKKLFKTLPAKVRVTVPGDESAAVEPAPATASQPVSSPAPAQPAAPAREAAPETVAPAAQKAASAAPSPKAAVLKEEPELPVDLESDPAAKRAAEYLTGILQAAGASGFKVGVLRQGDATLIRIEGGDIDDKIETRGETIQALSYLTDRAVNKGVDKKDPAYLRVRLDVAGYRGRREGELIALAQRTGKEVAQSGRSHTLAPMNPYERLIIHTTISEMEGVMSESIGSDTERRVVVKSTSPGAKDGGDWHGNRDGGRKGGDRNRRGGSGGRSGNHRDAGRRNDRDRKGGGQYGDKRSSTPEREYADRPRDPGAEPVVPQRREAIKDGEDLPLYGKIEL